MICHQDMNIQFSLCFITGQQVIPSEMNIEFFNDFLKEMKSLLKRMITQVPVGHGVQGLSRENTKGQWSRRTSGSPV